MTRAPHSDRHTNPDPAPVKDKYDPAEIEPRQRALWQEAELYRWRPERVEKPKWFVQSMFPYPSGDLHVGHWFAYTGGDIAARFKRMEGYNVLHPQGFDAFGLPAENAAIRDQIHPQKWTYQNIANMRRQFELMGNSYDWSRQIVTCNPEYYKWNQIFFLKLLEHGLAHRSDGSVNWCPDDQTTLANEQVKDGKCERCEAIVIKRDMPQWYFAITKYADELLDTSEIDWPEKILVSQRNWIGRSEGVNISFDISEYGLETKFISTFTTRIDTIYGVTFLVLSPEHPLADRLTQTEQKEAVDNYVTKAARASEIERISNTREKTGVRTGAYCINPLNRDRVPIFVGDYVLATYGTGAVMGVPAHDARDLEFARKYELPVRTVVNPPGCDGNELQEAYTGNGVQINSCEFDGMSNEDAKEAIADKIQANGWGERTVSYHMRDWLISRQRYWGTPIPIIYCDRCGIVPVPYDELPVKLPEDAEFTPSGKSPLTAHKGFLNAPCPKCNAPAQRETDTMDTFMDSSWYHMRYLSPQDNTKPFDLDLSTRWAPVDQYTGGMEHAVMHLLYARFFNRALRDMGLLHFNEPYRHLFIHGALTTDEGKISKRSNPIAPDPLVAKYGADTLRCYLMFLGPWDKGGGWSDSGINGIRRWLHRVWEISLRASKRFRNGAELDRDLERASHRLSKSVIKDMHAYKYNTVIAALMTYVNQMNEAWDRNAAPLEQWKASVQRLLLHLAPLAPHIADELWQRNGWKFSIHNQNLPQWDEEMVIAETVRIVVQVNGKVRDTISMPADAGEKEVSEAACAATGVQRHTKGKEIRRTIYVPGRLMNIVAT